MNGEDPHTHACFAACTVCVCFLLLLFFICFGFAWSENHCAESLRQLCYQQPLDSYQGRECEIISRHGDCPLTLHRALLQHLISTLLMLCVTTEILYSQRETDSEGTDSLEAATLHAHVCQSYTVTKHFDLLSS